MGTTCAKCDRNIPDGMDACQYCGHVIVTRRMTVCTTCEHDVPADKHTCEFCGAQLADSETTHCPACDRDLPGNEHTCPYCGTVIKPDQKPPDAAPLHSGPLRWENDDSEELDAIRREAEKPPTSSHIKAALLFFILATAGMAFYLTIFDKPIVTKVLFPEDFRRDRDSETCCYRDCQSQSSGQFFVATDKGDVHTSLCNTHRALSGELRFKRSGPPGRSTLETLLLSLGGGLLITAGLMLLRRLLR